MTTILHQFSEKNILIKSVGPHQYAFSFDGTEDEFVNALKEVMKTYGYVKQNENWFPGDPVEEGNDAYYIENPEEDVYMAFDWSTKELIIT